MPTRLPAPIVDVRALERSFARGGLLDALTLDSRVGGFPLKYRPKVVKAVAGVTLSIGQGEIVGLVGESGCGKSTLGRCIVDLISPTAGSVMIAGEAIAGAVKGRRRALLGRAQIVFQNPDSSLNPRKTVQDIIARPLTLFGALTGPARDRRVMDLLEMVQLGPHYALRFPHQLSGGEKQRVGIARALATQPDFIVCDEAVSALDVSVQASVLNLLTDLRTSLGVAYMFISHDLSVVAHIADRICVMFAGVIVEDGPTSGILNGPRHPYTEALLRAVPRLDNVSAGSIGRKAAEGAVTLRSTDVFPSASGGDLSAMNVAVPRSADACVYAQRCARKYGPECDMITPPTRLSADGHRIVCHIPLDELAEGAAPY